MSQHSGPREVEEQRAHRGQALGVRDPHRSHDVGPQVLPQAEPTAENLVDFGAEGPHLVRCSGLLRPRHHDWLPNPVQAAQRQEHTELEPPHQELAKGGRRDVPALEPADVSGPPRDARQADVQPGGDLPSEVLEGRADIARPDGRAVSLAACPGGPAEQYGAVLTFVGHAIVEGLRVQQRIDVADL